MGMIPCLFVLKTTILDDSKCFNGIKSVADCSLLQEKLNEAMKWSDEWDLKFNIKKTALVRFSKKGYGPRSFDYEMQGNIISVSHTTRDLGVHFLSDADQINYCLQQKGMLKSNFL
uniref:Reverse transcriptase domain-containing protein n=1 Tax=Amphimedon queenslandica TaxID=400682 RepID=A0A1X7USC2_AMPQE